MNIANRTPMTFSGSYDPSDVTFLLKSVTIQTTDIAKKEANIQSGRKHYSEMISDEARPDETYLELYQTALDASRGRIASEVMGIAAEIVARINRGEMPYQITLCSLVRAGVPLGVLLTRALRLFGVDTAHYGVSIIRDRGIDANAMRHIMAERKVEGIIFVDGWTGKGAITRELIKTWRDLVGRQPVLAVLADPYGSADIAGSREDWLIPTGILGANISGLVSRSILNDDVVGPGDFHGTMIVDHLADIDLSRAFVDEIYDVMRKMPEDDWANVVTSDDGTRSAQMQRNAADTCIASLLSRFGFSNRNRLKPGIAEATRAVLRRKPDVVIVSDPSDPELSALIHLCEKAGVSILHDAEATGPWRAITIIAEAK
jgi:hypothetical protein